MERKIRFIATILGALCLLLTLSLMINSGNSLLETKRNYTSKEIFIQNLKNICSTYIKNGEWCNTVKINFTSGSAPIGETHYVLGKSNSVRGFNFNEKILNTNYTPIIKHELTHAYIVFNVKNKDNFDALTVDAQNNFKNYKNRRLSTVGAMEVETECLTVKKFNYSDDYIKKSFYLSLSSTVAKNGVKRGCEISEVLLKKHTP